MATSIIQCAASIRIILQLQSSTYYAKSFCGGGWGGRVGILDLSASASNGITSLDVVKETVLH